LRRLTSILRIISSPDAHPLPKHSKAASGGHPDGGYSAMRYGVLLSCDAMALLILVQLMIQC
jgi:hypothetical protein